MVDLVPGHGGFRKEGMERRKDLVVDVLGNQAKQLLPKREEPHWLV